MDPTKDEIDAVDAARRVVEAHIKEEQTDMDCTPSKPALSSRVEPGKDTYDGLGDLQVCFGEPSPAQQAENQEMQMQQSSDQQTPAHNSVRTPVTEFVPNTSQQGLRRSTRKPCHTQRVWRLDIVGSAFDRWKRIGDSQGLNSDTEIAVFLMEHYENALAGMPTGASCISCQASLILTCAMCHIPSQMVDILEKNIQRPQKTMLRPKKNIRPKRSVQRQMDSTTNNTNASPVDGEISALVEPKVPEEEPEDKSNDMEAELPSDTDFEPEKRPPYRRGKRGRPPGSGKKLGKGKPKLRKFVCQWEGCESAFTKSSRLKAHNRTHTGEKPFVCRDCTKAFTQSSGLKVHMQKHTGLRPFSCDECNASFPSSSTLKQHMRRHTGEKPFHCKECDKSFRWSGHLTQHMRAHAGIKPFLCPDCGKAFAASSDLVKHRVTHTGDRPYACNQCDKAYSFLHRLTAHMRSHTGDRPFLCNQCGAAFARAHNLTVHLRVHTGDKPYRCKECGATFADSGNFSKHKKIKHGAAAKNAANNAKMAAKRIENAQLAAGAMDYARLVADRMEGAGARLLANRIEDASARFSGERMDDVKHLAERLEDANNFVPVGNAEQLPSISPHLSPPSQHRMSPATNSHPTPISNRLTSPISVSSHLASPAEMAMSPPLLLVQQPKASPSPSADTKRESPIPLPAHQVQDYRTVPTDGVAFPSYYNYPYYYSQQ